MQFICDIMQFIYDVMRFICYIMQFIYDVVQFICYIMQFVYDVMQFICDIMQFTCSVTHLCCSVGHFGCAMRPHFIGMLEVLCLKIFQRCLFGREEIYRIHICTERSLKLFQNPFVKRGTSSVGPKNTLII